VSIHHPSWWDSLLVARRLDHSTSPSHRQHELFRRGTLSDTISGALA
jgi:hypothetical protein